MIGCLPTQALAFLAVFVYATHATQAIAFEWKPGLRRDVDEIDDRLCQSMSLDVFVFIRDSLRRCCYRHLADDQASSSSDKTFCDNCRLHHRRYQLLYAYSHVKRGA